MRTGPSHNESQNGTSGRQFLLARRGCDLVAVKIRTTWGGWGGSSRRDWYRGTVPCLCGRLGVGSGPCRPGQTVCGLLRRAAVGRGPQERRTIGGGDRPGANGGATPVPAASRAAGTLVRSACVYPRARACVAVNR